MNDEKSTFTVHCSECREDMDLASTCVNCGSDAIWSPVGNSPICCAECNQRYWWTSIGLVPGDDNGSYCDSRRPEDNDD